MNESDQKSDIVAAGRLNSRKIKVCRIATVSYYLVSQLKAQAEYLKNFGMKVVLISSDGPELSKLDLDCNLIHEVVDIPRSIKPWKDVFALLALIKTIRKHKFDIVHSTTPKAGLLTAIAAFLLRVPVRLHTWTGQQWINLNGPIRWASILSDRIIGGLNTRCYADSNSQRNFLLGKKITTRDKLHVIGYGSLAGVDLNCFNPDRWSRPEKEAIRSDLSISPSAKVLIFVGRISRDKGIMELISAFQKLLHLKYDVDLLLIGPRDQDCGGADLFSLSGIDLNPRIHYIGYTKHPERYLAISDIHCLPSYREGFGTVVIEAAAMGIPTVGTQINGLIDAVDNGKTGILVPAHDERSLFDALCKMLDDSQLVCRMGDAAKKRCMKRFDSNFVNKLVVEEYQRLLNNIDQKR
jgi:glycosyltransferase involved in cell wall biosynthesis